MVANLHTKLIWPIALIFYIFPANAQTVNDAWNAYAAQDFTAAAEILMPLAESGDPNAQHLLGDLYLYGQGVAVDQELAAEWKQRAAEQGLAVDQEFVGQYLLEKDGDDNKKSAFEWSYKAALNDLPSAQNTVGYFYEEGIGVEKDVNKAVLWYLLAADAGMWRPEEAVKRLIQGDQYIKARLKAYKPKNSLEFRALGLFYLMDDEGVLDLYKASENLVEAASKGDVRSLILLASINKVLCQESLNVDPRPTYVGCVNAQAYLSDAVSKLASKKETYNAWDTQGKDMNARNLSEAMSVLTGLQESFEKAQIEKEKLEAADGRNFVNRANEMLRMAGASFSVSLCNLNVDPRKGTNVCNMNSGGYVVFGPLNAIGVMCVMNGSGRNSAAYSIPGYSQIEAEYLCKQYVQ